MNQKRNSRGKLNGQILMLQNDLMSKLASITYDSKPADQLGFQFMSQSKESDSLTNLINRSKNITSNNKSKIEIAKRNSLKNQTGKSNKDSEGTFLTGVGVFKENQENYERQSAQHTARKEPEWHPSEQTIAEDPNEMLKELIRKNNDDDLAQLRKMIKKTGENLQDYSKKFNKSKKSILQIAQKYSKEMKPSTLDKMINYRQFQTKDLDEEEEEVSYEPVYKKVKARY